MKSNLRRRAATEQQSCEHIAAHVGQAGVQVRDGRWEPCCLEHSIQPKGQVPMTRPLGEEMAPSTTSSVRRVHVRRPAFGDLGPGDVDEVHTGSPHQDFCPRSSSPARKLPLITMPQGPTPLARRSLALSWTEFRNWPASARVFRASWFPSALEGDLSPGSPPCRCIVSLSIMARSPSWSSPLTQPPRFPGL